MANEPQDFINEPISADEPPLAGDSYCLYFVGINTTAKDAKTLKDKLEKYFQPLRVQHTGEWSREDPKYFDVLKAFNVTDTPAFVFTKPWSGSNLGENWDWSKNSEMLAQIDNRNEMPVHCTIQGEENFKDQERLLDTIEKLSILFGGNSGEELKNELRNRRIREVVSNTFHGAKELLKGLSLTFGVGGYSVKLSYDKDGIEVGADPEEKERDEKSTEENQE